MLVFSFLFLWRHQLAKERIKEDDMSGPQTRLDGLPSRLQSHAKAVHSAAGLPAKLVSELDSSQHPVQDSRRCQKQSNLLRERTHLHMMVLRHPSSRPFQDSSMWCYFQNHCLCPFDYPFYHLTAINIPLPMRSNDTRLFRYVSTETPPIIIMLFMYFIIY